MSNPTEQDTMTGVNALLHQIIDYAGLFPPAKLDMAQTVTNYASYIDTPHAWMLGRIIVPTARLDEFESHANSLLPTGDEAEPWHISALTAPAGDDAMSAHLERIAEFNRVHDDAASGLARVDVIELKGNAASDIEAALDLMPDEIFPFFELPLDRDLRGLAASLVGSDAGAKVRTGGVTADLYPTPEQLAAFLMACCGAGLPFKATAGLHHPLRHFSNDIQAREFGFLNVFVAAALIAHRHVDTGVVIDVLTDEDASSFTFDDDGLAWKDIQVHSDQVARTRQQCAISFGSCSFVEPCDDLTELGLLPDS